MSIKKIRPKTNKASSNLTVRMADERMASDRMINDRGPGSIAGRVQSPSYPPAGQNNFAQRSEDVDQENSTENK